MVTLGMSAHTDRMIKLLVENGVTNTAVLERLLVHGIPRVSLLYSSLSPSAEIWIKYIYNICIIYIMSSNSYWTLLMPTSILQGFAHFCPFLKGFFSIQHPQHPPSQAGLIMAKKSPGLNGDRCMELNLPWVLVEAAQKRWTSEKMNLGHLDTKSWVHTEVDGSLKNVSISFVRDSVLGVYTIGLTMCLFWFRFQYLSLYCVLGRLS